MLERKIKHAILLCMSDEFKLKKIAQLRTFATDAKHARLRMPEERPVSTSSEQPIESVPAEKKVLMQKQSDTLSKEIVQIAKTERASILSDTGLTYESESTTDGVIIRDKRHKRFKLFPAMVEASTSWFTGVQVEHKKRLDSVPKVKTAESRIEVIEEAVRGSEQAPKEDYDIVAQHLKNVERVPISTAISFKEKSAIPEPTWSSLTDTEDSKETIPVVDAITVPEVHEILAVTTQVPEKQNDPIPVVITPHLEVTEVREQVIDTALDALFDSKEDVPQIKTPEVIVEIPEQNTKLEVIKEAAASIQSPDAVYETLMKPVEIATPIKPQMQYAPPKDTHSRKSLYMYLLIGVIIVSSLGGVLVTYYFFSFAKTSSIVSDRQETETVSLSLIQEQSSMIYIMPRTATEHILEIQQKIKTSEAVTRLIPNLQTETNMREATVEELLISLSLNAPSSFLRSIKEVTLGGVDGTDMFIVLRVSTFDVAFAGMLAWEETLQSDFSPLFNTNQSRALTFTDTLTSNKNSRLLKDVTGEDVLTYTFTDKNTILITSTRTILERLIPLVK